MTRDPLEALKAPKRDAIDPDVQKDDSHLLDPEALKDHFLVAAHEAKEAMTEPDEIMPNPKVIACYSCNEYAFDGTFTAYMTEEEGDQPFCLECVAGIEKRSGHTTAIATNGYSTKPMEFPFTDFTWKPTGDLYIGDVLVGSSSSDSTWANGTSHSHSSSLNLN